ncbi:(2Fe-2S) ferredoxin domain-containing protein [Nodosilinea sp. E11]|uniref:(2Fe-2S) ferredoxin domain-containing protein n=1 Tax=Nodosilinea sp. E11 TaxID=3037479 RepID=UPI0029343DAD|nr:(2Fe-2S) ferredoxin domain-containing protein [Nodosilinea sp. E11]WOD40135.1 (2Fe-2S) ferredoxin domain-containing protein [Nodosilinea sp. E11]
MSDTTSLPPWMFNLDGTFLGFVEADPIKVKTICLEVDGEVLAIKLRKEVRALLRSRLQPGDYLRCIGRSELDGDIIKLKAYQVFTLLPPLPKTCTLPSPVTPSTQQSATQPARTLKIRMCRKSGCQKRGGKQLAEALGQALRDRNLHTQVEIQYTGCQKHCSEAPTFTVDPGHHRYSRVQPSRLPAILDRHFTPTKPNSR